METCSNCKFYESDASLSESGGECRRYAPRYKRINYAQLAYLQAIALSVMMKAKIELENVDIDITKEVTETYHETTNWCDVSPDDWCGEYAPSA